MKKYLIGLGMMLVLATSAHAFLYANEAVDLQGRPLKDGDLISAANYGDPDIYIIKFAPGGAGVLTGAGSLPDAGSLGYKRLFLSPAIFDMYKHLQGYGDVPQVSTRVRDAFATSGLFRNCETNNPSVWATEVTGEDTGVLHHIQMTGDEAVRQDPFFFWKVFCINSREENFYVKSAYPYTQLAQIPPYTRITCIPRPACLDSVPQCLPPEPVSGWCPTATPTPPPGCYYQQIQCFTTPCNPVLVCPSATPTPSADFVSISDLAWTTAETSPRQYTAVINGSLTSTCEHISSINITSTSGRIDIWLYAAAYTDSLSCTQVTSSFNRAIPIPSEYASGNYSVFVNGTFMNNFAISR